MHIEDDRRDPVILIAAAGRSVRMRGSDKLLRKIDGVPQLRRIALAAFATGCPVAVTLPPDCPSRHAALEGLEICLLTVTECSEGISASLRTGAAFAEDRPMMLVLADMPDLSAQDLARMVELHRLRPHDLLRASGAGGEGHPVLFPADLVAELHDLSGDIGARSIVTKHADKLRSVPMPGRNAVLDLDTPEAWASWEADQARSSGQFSAGAELVADPLKFLLATSGPAVIAVITGVEGTSYRSVGTLMVLLADRTVCGSLTNGCIEADLAMHAAEVFATGRPKHLRYGDGSPYFDIRLPCGGGIDIGLFPVSDRRVLEDASYVLAGRNAISVSFGPEGDMRLEPFRNPGWNGARFSVAFRPATRAIVFGDGLEAETLTRLMHAAGIQTKLISAPLDPAGLESPLTCRRPPGPDDILQAQLLADPWTAVVTLYHDHDKEIDILGEILRGPAFYVGAQGSKRVAQRRTEQLRLAGLDETHLAKLHAPAGLIPSTRDPQSLAVSILADVIAARLNLDR